MMENFPPVEGTLLLSRERFEELYATYNRPEYIHPDPLELVLRFHDHADQEIAGLVASSLAYGNVKQILASLERVFAALPNPADDLKDASRGDLRALFSGFRHRWTTGDEIGDLLFGIRLARERWGSLERCFTSGLEEGDEDILPALTIFVENLRQASGSVGSSLLSCPSKGSACKRLLLYLRWMSRRDAVDPGPWSAVDPSMLVAPMDTHMHRIAVELGLTHRRQTDLKAARSVTGFFRGIAPEDPVRYDFTLTRFGIRDGMGISAVLQHFAA